MDNLFEIGFHFSTVDDVVEEIAIPEKIATLQKYEIATTERSDEETLENDDVIEEMYMCEEIASTERCNSETVENDGKLDEEDRAASDSTTFYDIAEIGITTSRCKNSDYLKADHHDAENTAARFTGLSNSSRPDTKMKIALPDIIAKHSMPVMVEQ
ncbi:Hypothetical predicted protein [Mytilus galloprovincialis]|uniref:Uncharacterized protein n=1 Tax=Mytilus galloprovincialis TaxID=29158 RepID=A0A8B6ED66_MYTGA|nr:Hypothetical predicted protein [Mytilus galloprovincialis]